MIIKDVDMDYLSMEVKTLLVTIRLDLILAKMMAVKTVLVRLNYGE